MLDAEIATYLRRAVLEVALRDNVRARILQPDGSYVRRQPGPAEPAVDSQAWLLANACHGGRGAHFR